MRRQQDFFSKYTCPALKRVQYVMKRDNGVIGQMRREAIKV